MAKTADKAERRKKKSKERDLWSSLYALCVHLESANFLWMTPHRAEINVMCSSTV